MTPSYIPSVVVLIAFLLSIATTAPSWHLYLTAHALALPIKPIHADNVAGIWRLSSKVSFLPSSDLKDASRDAVSSSSDDEALLVLSVDGSFAPCKDSDGQTSSDIDSPPSSSFVLGGSTCGRWNFDNCQNEMILIPNRPMDADERNVHDLMLCGKVVAASASSQAKDDTLGDEEEDTFLTIKDGTIAIGRCMYPRIHPSFFDEPGPLIRSMHVGTFGMVQVLGSLNTNLEDDDDDYDGGEDTRELDGAVYCDEDFFGRRFLMTVEPLHSIKGTRKYDEKKGAYDNMPFDLRVMPVEFHQNRTFTAIGVNKILRGRYHVKNSKLDMDVSLFGAGRSAPGSVYR